MNLRSKSTEIYLSASVSHYRGPFLLVGADAPVRAPYGLKLSYQLHLPRNLYKANEGIAI
jgi:hypothetical protein